MFLWIQRVGADRMHRFSVAVHDKCPPGLKKRSKLIMIANLLFFVRFLGNLRETVAPPVFTMVTLAGYSVGGTIVSNRLYALIPSPLVRFVTDGDRRVRVSFDSPRVK